MQKYQVLYSGDSSGNVRIWYMEREDNKYRATAGIKDGQLVTAEWTVTKPKNEGKTNATTAEQQADAEVKAKYKKQLKTGYHKDIKDIDKSQYFEPMLAKEFKNYVDKINWNEGIGVQIKFNGVRVIAKKDGLFSRKGERYICLPHIEKALKPFFDKFPDAVLDGEAFNYGLRTKLNELIKLTKKTVHITPEDLKRSEELVRYYIYDGAVYNIDLQSPYKDRYASVLVKISYCCSKRKDPILGIVDLPQYIEEVKTEKVHSLTELDLLYQKFLKDNQEGAMIRILSAPYENKRSKYLLKYKPVDDAEFEIIDAIEGEGNRTGMIGKFICKMENGDTFGASMKGCEEQFIDIWKNRKYYIGKKATIFFNGYTGKGIPNYARFDCNNSVIGEIK